MESNNSMVVTDNVLVKYVGDSAIAIIPEGISEIGEGAFDRNETVKKVILPETLKVIAKWAFFRCNNLEEIKLPKHLISIGERAFFSTSLKKSLYREEQ